MIIFREKLFRRDIFLDYPSLLDKPELVEKFGESELSIETSDKYNEDISKLGVKGSPDRKRLDSLKKDIRQGYLTSDGPAGGKTHFLGDFSKAGKFYTFSKKISDQHRLNYKIYPPKEYIKNGVHKHLLRVVLESCYDHELTEGNYLEDKELRARKNRMRGNAPYRKPESIMKKKKKF